MSSKKLAQRKQSKREESDESEDDFDELFNDDEDYSDEDDENDSDEENKNSRKKILRSDQSIMNILIPMLDRASKQIIISPQSFETFVSFIKLYCDIDTEEHVKKLLFNASCSSCRASAQSVALFMLSNKKCNDNILTSSVAGGDPWIRSQRDDLSIEILKNVSDPNSFLKQKNNDCARIFRVGSVPVLKYILSLESVDSSTFMVSNYDGYSYFYYMVTFAENEMFKCLMESDKCTRDVITCPVTNKNAYFFLHHLFRDTQKFLIAIKSNKLIDSDFEHRETPKSTPFYYEIFNSNDKVKIKAFLDSQYCTAERIEKYIDTGNRRSDSNTIRVIFSHPKFASVKDKYDFRNKKLVKKLIVVQPESSQSNDTQTNYEFQALKLELEISKMETERLRLENELLKNSPK